MLEGLIVRNLQEEDLTQVQEMDSLSGNHVEEWVDSDGSFGLFQKEKLIGYLTLGYADGCGPAIENHPSRTIDSHMLSNVYIRKEYRGKGHGRLMIEEVLKGVDESVFLSFLHDGLQSYYEKIGFRLIEDYHMVKARVKEGEAK